MLKNYSAEDKVLLAVDCIIFGFDNDDLKVLLIKRNFEPEKGKWSLIGGFLKKNETLDDSANKILHSLTGFHDIYMEQLYAYSDVHRDPVERTISVAYFALIDIARHHKDLNEKYSAKWFSVSKVPPLIFDHSTMVDKAIKRLRRRTAIKPIGFELLPEKFTMLQLQKLYETILDETLDKRNFINKINSLKILIRLDEKDMNSSRKGSYLYKFNKEKYEEKVNNGFSFKL